MVKETPLLWPLQKIFFSSFMAGLIDTEPRCPHPSHVSQAGSQAPTAAGLPTVPAVRSALVTSPSEEQSPTAQDSVLQKSGAALPFASACFLSYICSCFGFAADMLLPVALFFYYVQLPAHGSGPVSHPRDVQAVPHHLHTAVGQDRPPMFFRRVKQALCSWLQLHTGLPSSDFPGH